MKKFFLTLCVLLLCSLCLTACSSDEEDGTLNSGRGTDYQYDFLQLIDIKLYGSEGAGFIEVSPKDLSVDDFDSESEYIAVMRAVESLGLYVGPDSTKTTYLTVSPNGGLSNGDVVTLSIEGFDGTISGITLNLESYSFVVSGLGTATVVDLFDSSIVTFFGLEGTTEVYYQINDGSSLSSEILDNLVYTVSTTATSLEEGKTILDVTATLDETFLTTGDDPAYTTYVYFGRRGMLASQTSEKVLMTVISPIDFDEVDSEALMESLISYLNSQTITLSGQEVIFKSLGTLQQYYESSNSYNPYTYTITFTVEVEGEERCLSVDLKIVELDGEYLILERSGNYKTATSAYCSSAFTEMTMIINFNSIVTIGEEVEVNEEDLIEEDVTEESEEVE